MRKLILLALLLLTASVSNGLNLLTESFDNATFPPTGWTKTSSGSLTWARATSSTVPVQTPHSGAGEANFNSFYVSSGSADLITPSISFVGGTGIMVSFWMYRDNGYSSSADKVDVYVNTSASSTGGTLLGTINRSSSLTPTVSSNGWYQYSFVVPASFTSSSNYIVFHGTSQFGNDIFIDDVSVDNPVCGATPLNPVITTAAMSPAAPICGGTKTMTATDPNQPVSGITYQWQSSLSSTGSWANVTAGSGATSLTYTSGPLSVTTYFRIGAYCVNSGITSYSTPYTVIVGAPQPGTISGRPTTCPGDTTTYSVPSATGTTYAWTLPAGWSFVTGLPTNGSSVLVTMGTFGGTISVTATSSCGGPSVPQTKTIFQGSAPATPATITGFSSVCSGTTQTYSIASVVGANSYVWSLPNGWTGSSSSSSITVLTDTTSGAVQVRAVNGCGSSTNASLAVTVINSLANPGTITSSSPSGTYCSGSLYSFSIVPVAGATSYQWTLPAGWSGVTSGTAIQAFAATAPGAGQVKVTAYVSCATSPTSTLSTPVTATVNPSVGITTTSALCQGVPVTFTATPSNGGTVPGYQWKKNGVNVFGSGASYTDATLVSGDVVAVVLSSNAICRNADTVRSNSIVTSITPSVTPGVSINTTPVVSICAGTTLNFTTTVTAPGTAPAYQWYRGSLPVATGPFWATSALSDGDTITVKLTSNAACATQPTVTSNKVGIKVSPVVVPSITASASSTTADGSPVTFTATQSGGGATPVYQWILNNVDIPGATGDTYQAMGLVAGDRVSVRMQSYASCAAPDVVTSNEVVMGSALGIAGAGAWTGGASLYPNPVGGSGKLTVAASWNGVHSGSERVSVEVLNTLGQVVYRSEVAPGSGATTTGAAQQWHYDVVLGEGIPGGHYVLRLQAPQSNMNAALPFVLDK